MTCSFQLEYCIFVHMCPLLLVTHVPSIVSILVSTIHGSQLELVACFQCVSEHIQICFVILIIVMKSFFPNQFSQSDLPKQILIEKEKENVTLYANKHYCRLFEKNIRVRLTSPTCLGCHDSKRTGFQLICFSSYIYIS